MAQKSYERVLEIDLDQIEPECNDRTVFDEKDLFELAESIRKNGLAQPITVRPKPDGGYWIVAGERRWRAHRLLGWPAIKALVRDLDDSAASNVMLVENLARKDLNPLEEGLAYKKRLESGADIAELARTAGVSMDRIRWRIGLVDLCPYVRKMVENGSLGPGYAACMIGLDEQRQLLALAALNQKNLTLQDLEILCANLLADQNQGSMFDSDSFLQIDEIVKTATQANVKLSSMQLTRLVARVLEFAKIDESTLTDEQRTDLAQLRAVLDYRLTVKATKKRDARSSQ